MYTSVFFKWAKHNNFYISMWTHWVNPCNTHPPHSRGRRRQRRQNNKINYKKRTWICEIKLTFVPSCSRVRRQLLHFHVVCKTWSIFQQLSSIFSFRKTCWRQLKFSKNRNKQCNQSKYMLKIKHKVMSKYFYCLPTSPSPNVFLKFPDFYACGRKFASGSVTSRV